MRSLNRILSGSGALLCAVALTLGSSPLPAEASQAQSKVVSANPSDNTPQIVLGTNGETVFAFAQIGSTVFTGGRFTQVQNPKRTVTYARQNFFAYNATTGAVDPLNLAFDGIVQTLVPSADGKALYIGGSYKTINGVAHKAIVKYNLATQQLDATFNPPTANGTVADAHLVNGRLIVAGTLSKYLLALDPTTGADTHYITAVIAGVTNTHDITKVRRFSVNPAGTRLVALGNFATIDAQPRRWAFELNLDPTTSALNTWHAARLDVVCASTSLNVASDVDFSPDGTYFVIATSGGPTGSAGMCDAAGRFETSDISGTAAATWVNFTGGDSLYSVAVTGAAVYVGGHPRWLDNPLGHNSAGPGAVDRLGIGAIDPVSGKANSWNPGKTRGHGAERMYVTSTGLWVGSDGQYFAGENHAGIAFCPLTK
jgi:hypothetical protein